MVSAEAFDCANHDYRHLLSISFPATRQDGFAIRGSRINRIVNVLGDTVWMTDDATSGMPPSWLGREERKSTRRPAEVHALLSGPHFETEPVSISDVSSLGCRVVADKRVSVGSYVTLTLPGFSQVEGWVAWTGAREFGLDFSHPLNDAVVGHVVGLSG